MYHKKDFPIRLFIILLFSVFIISCKKGKDTPTIAPPVKVKVIEVSQKNQDSSREYSGTVVSAESTTVSFSVGGTITELYATEGQKVSKGQLLGKVKNGEYLNAYNIAEAQLAEAQDGYERLKKLHDANALPDVKWVEMEQKLKQAQNMVEMAKRSLDDANLHSPVTGTVIRKFADIGETVLPATPVYEIASTDKLEIEVPVSENEIGYFSIGEKADVRFESLYPSPLEGEVIRKAVVADPLTRAYTVKLKIPNHESKILPGMIGSVSFQANNRNDSLSYGIDLPPQSVLLDEYNRWFVWVANDSVAARRFVTADELTANGILVTTGLNPGDKVIVEGVQKVGTGTRIEY